MRLTYFCSTVFYLISLSFTSNAFFGLTSQRAEFSDATMVDLRRKPSAKSNELSVFTSEKYLCKPLQLNKRRKHICRARTGYPSTLANAFKLAVIGCRNQFKHEKWNCALGPSRTHLLKKAYPETAYLYAITAASLVYSFARSCSRGHLDDCSCEEFNNGIPQRSDGKGWARTGCSDNISAAKELVKRFAAIAPNKNRRDFVSNIARHNMNVGLKVLESNVKRRCKCHGISGSCVTRTCWSTSSPFYKIAEGLNIKYKSMSKKSSFQGAGKRSRQLIDPGSDNLWYRESTPDFCFTHLHLIVKERECIPRTMWNAGGGEKNQAAPSCESICCGASYHAKYETLSDRCDCIIRKYNLLCSKCEERKLTYFCQ